MLKVDDYRQHAAECRRLAASAALPHLREELTKMAEAWDALADQRESILANKLRLEDIGRAIGVTRERVRQICDQYAFKAATDRMVADAALPADRG